MLDRRSEKEILRDIQEQRQGVFGSWLGRARQLFIISREFTPLVELLVVLVIIASVAALFLPTLFRARGKAYVVTCLERLNQIGVALEIYNMDFEAYPPPGKWYAALRRHLGPMDDTVLLDERGIPIRTHKRRGGKAAQPFKCTADQTNALISYYYLAPSLRLGEQRSMRPSEIPMVVDETYHAQVVTILWHDYHQSTLPKDAWLDLRTDVLKIRRAVEHPDWFCFVPARQPPSPTGLPESP